MSNNLRNALVWLAVALTCLVLWYFTARLRLHFLRPGEFLAYVAVAAAALTALLWWEVASRPDDDDT